jgi:hypothetical protein
MTTSRSDEMYRFASHGGEGREKARKGRRVGGKRREEREREIKRDRQK